MDKTPTPPAPPMDSDTRLGLLAQLAALERRYGKGA